jgi:tetratricopeptide (TPR) repeat protein
MTVSFSLLTGRNAYKLKLVKWFLSGVLWAVSCASLLRADQAADLFSQAATFSAHGDYKSAAPLLDQIIANYPSTSNIDEVRLDAGVAHLHLGEYDKAVDSLSKEVVDPAPAQYRASALYYTGYAQLLKGGKLTDDTQRKQALGQSTDTMTKLVTYVTANPTPDNQDYLESAYYNRALAYLYEDDLPNAEKDVNQLLQQFSSSLQKPDYLLLLGNLYARQGSEAAQAKQPDDVVHADTDKAIAAFDQAIHDPNALIQANDASLAKAEVLYFLATLTQQDPGPYQKAIDAFRLVRRKADLIPGQQANVDALRAKNQALAQQGQGAAVSTANSLLIERESDRLTTLQSEPDPILQALIRIAQCYNAIGQPDEARTVLHRLAHAKLTDEQQQEADFALLYSYVLGHETGKADQALTAYLAKHPGDVQAQGISIQIGNDLMKRGDATGALAQANRSLNDFPKGDYVSEAIVLKVAALTSLGRKDEAQKVGDDFLKSNPNSSAAINIALSTAQRQASDGDLAGALASYQKVRDSGTSKELQAAGAAGYIQTLETMGRIDDVIQESKTFADKYPDTPELPSILVMSAVAMDQKHDPGAVAALQDEARRFPADTPNSPSAFALFYIVNIYQRDGKVPEMIQAAEDLKKAFPTQYTYLLQAADAVSAAYIKQKKFDLAAEQYQFLADSSQLDVAAMAADKIGEVWLAAAKAMEAYQSMQEQSDRDEAEKRLGTATQSFIGVLKSHSDQLPAVDEAFQGLDSVLLQRRSWGLLKQADFEDYFTKLTADLTAPEMQPRLELAKAGLVFLDKKNGAAQYPAALARFKTVVSAHPDLQLTRTEASRYGELLFDGKDYPTALQVYNTLLNSDPKNPQVLADGYYGLGATYLAQGDLAQAQNYFSKMKALPGGSAWHPHILDADYGLALAAESGPGTDLDAAKATYAQIMQAPEASIDLLAKSMLGYGRILEKEGHPTSPAAPGTIEYAVHYYQQVDTIYGPSVPELSAEGLYDAGQAYDKAGDKADAKKQYESILTNYKTTAPDWAAKAQAAAAQD